MGPCDPASSLPSGEKARTGARNVRRGGRAGFPSCKQRTSRPAVVQAQENLRLVRVKYGNGDATPTDIVDAETALTRSQQRLNSAIYTYLAALARLDYAMGREQRPRGGP